MSDTKPIRIPADLHADLKVEAAVRQEGLGDMVAEHLKQICAGNSRQRRTAKRKQNGAK